MRSPTTPTSDEAPAFPWLATTGVFLAVTALLTAVISAAGPAAGAGSSGITGVDGWFQFDSAWYAAIVRNGYFYVPGQQSSIAFFPVFPLVVRPLAALTGSVQLAGQGVALLSGLVAVLLFGRWVWERMPVRSATLSVAVVLAYPYTLFLHGPMYADGLYLALAIAAFSMLDRRWYLAAGLVGALATATRPFGVAVAIGLVVRALELIAQDRGERPVTWRSLVRAVRGVRWRHAGVLVAFGGLAAWMAYLWATFGTPLAFVETESAPGWDQGVGPHTWFKFAYFGRFADGQWRMVLDLTPQALACLAVLLLLPRVLRRFGWGYLAYTMVVIAIPIVGTKDFMGAGRYALAAFPAMAAGGDWLAERPRWFTALVLAAMVVAMVVFSYYFTSGVEVS